MNPNREFLKPNDCVLLLVDMQKVLLDLCVDSPRVVRNTAALIEVAKVFAIPVVFSVQNAEKLGGFLPELTGLLAEPNLIHKMEFNCFENEAIERAVRETGRKTILLAGTEGHVCIFHTGAGALGLGYTVHVASDAVTSRTAPNRQIGLDRLEKAGAVISSTEMIIFELLHRAGTPQFRAVLPLLKTFENANK
jgi:nicotinamidase-related amidase